MNSLKIVSIKKFVEHVVDSNPLPEKDKIKPKEQAIILSKEEREANLLSKFKSAISKSLENLNIKNLLDLKPDNDKESVIEDDNVSVTSSRYFASGMAKGYKSVKLPFIIGTQEFFKNEYLGVSPSDSVVNNTESNINLDRKVSSVSELKNNLNIEDFTGSNTDYNMIQTQKNQSEWNMGMGGSMNNYNNPYSQVNQPERTSNYNNYNPADVGKTSATNRNMTVTTKSKLKPPPLPVLGRKKNATLINKEKPRHDNILSTNEQASASNNTNNLSNLNTALNNSNLLNANRPQNELNPIRNEEPVSFKDNLAKMFAGGGMKMNPQTSANQDDSKFSSNLMNKNNINNFGSIPQQANTNFIQSNIKNAYSNLPEDKPKQIKLDNFIKRPTGLFQEDDDEEEDTTGLFKKTSGKRQIRNTLFDIQAVPIQTGDLSSNQDTNNKNSKNSNISNVTNLSNSSNFDTSQLAKSDSNLKDTVKESSNPSITNPTQGKSLFQKMDIPDEVKTESLKKNIFTANDQRKTNNLESTFI
jgi:hypothetical protein